jgi:hypothetical protein
MAGHQRTADTPVGGGRADGRTPRRAADRGGRYATDGNTCLRYGGRGNTEGAPTWRQGRCTNTCLCLCDEGWSCCWLYSIMNILNFTAPLSAYGTPIIFITRINTVHCTVLCCWYYAPAYSIILHIIGINYRIVTRLLVSRRPRL